MIDLAPAFVTLFVVIDPIGLVPLFIALTLGMDMRQGVINTGADDRFLSSACGQ